MMYARLELKGLSWDRERLGELEKGKLNCLTLMEVKISILPQKVACSFKTCHRVYSGFRNRWANRIRSSEQGVYTTCVQPEYLVYSVVEYSVLVSILEEQEYAKHVNVVIVHIFDLYYVLPPASSSSHTECNAPSGPQHGWASGPCQSYDAIQLQCLWACAAPLVLLQTGGVQESLAPLQYPGLPSLGRDLQFRYTMVLVD